jgi:hypothetical protein
MLFVCLVSGAFASSEDQPKMITPRPKAVKKVLPTGEVAPLKIEPLPASDYRGLGVVLTTGRGEYQFGESISFQSLIKCSSESLRLFNPFFEAVAERPGRVRVFDASDKLVAEYPDAGEAVSQAKPELWVQVPRDGSVGAGIVLRMGKDIRPGRYRAQLVLTETLVTGEKSEQVVASSALVPFKVVGSSVAIDH